MAELLLSDSPWILAVVYAVVSALNDVVNSYIDGFRNKIRRGVRNVISDGELSGQRDNVEVEVRIPRVAGRVVACVSLFLLCAYWDVVPRSVFLLFVGASVVMNTLTLLLFSLPCLCQYAMLSKTGYWGKTPEPSSIPGVTYITVVHAGICLFFVLCWMLTGSLIFLGTAGSAFIGSLDFSGKVFGTETSDEENVERDLQ